MDKTALIIDDSRLACKIMENMLDGMGLKSASVFSAEEALDYLSRKLPDIIFLDHSMPDMDGLETIKLIKANPRTATVPVMMYTAKEGEVYVGQARALGAVDVVPKGVEKDQLSRALSKMGFLDEEKDKIETQVKVAKTEDKPDESSRRFPETESLSNLLNKETSDKTQSADEPSIKVANETDWQTFWKGQIEPLLSRNRRQHSDEIHNSTRQLGIKVNREIHKTMEQFEHALISRIEAHDDYKDSQEEIKNKNTKRLYYVIALIVVVLQSGIFWQLNRSNQLTEALLSNKETEQNFQSELSDKLTQLSQKVESLDSQNISSFVEQSEVQIQQSVSLIDDFGAIVIQNLYLTNEVTQEYTGVTSSGYQLVVNASGEIGIPLGQRYFLTDNCAGEMYVDSANAMIYREGNGNLWYVDKLAPATDITVGSMINAEGQCVVGNNDVQQLRRIDRSNYLETGIDDSLTLSLVFNG